MPLISLTTNVKLDSEDAKRAFISEFSKFCAETIGKDEQYFNVEVSFNPYLMFGGTFDPTIMLKVISLDNTVPENTQAWSKAFSDYFERRLGVPNGRGLMAFTDPGPDFIGTKGTTVAAARRAS